MQSHKAARPHCWSGSRNWAQPLALEMGLELWDVEYKKEGGMFVLRYTLDAPQGLTLTPARPFRAPWSKSSTRPTPSKTVTAWKCQSAGLDRALKRPSDFERFLGARVEVGLYAPLGGSVEQAASLHFSVCDAPMPAAVKHFEARLEGYEPGR